MLPADAGVILTALVSLPVAASVLLIAHLARLRLRLPPAWFQRRWLVRSAIAVDVLYALVLGWGLGVEPRWVELTRTEIPVQGGVLGRERFRVVQLSDFHLGRRIGALERNLIERVREAKPDLLLLTGDYMDTRDASYALEDVVAALAAVAPPFGIWAVGGPIDEKFVARDILRRAKIEWLEDETRVIEEGGKRLRLAGRGAWPLVSFADLFGGLDVDTPTLLLQHGPAGLEEALEGRKGARVDLVLCGHTHGGQIRLPLRGALLPTAGGRDRGLYQVAGVAVYVNRGLGTTGVPLRLGARPEVALIELIRR